MISFKVHTDRVRIPLIDGNYEIIPIKYRGCIYNHVYVLNPDNIYLDSIDHLGILQHTLFLPKENIEELKKQINIIRRIK